MSDLSTGIVNAFAISLLVGVLTPIVDRIMRKRVRKRLRLREDELKKSWDEFRVRGKILTYPDGAWKSALVLFLVTGYLVFGVMVIIIVNLTEQVENPSLALAVSSSVALASFAMPWVAFVQITRVAHEVSSKGIKKGSPWSRKFYVSWEEIQSVSYNFWLDSYVLKTPKGTIRVRSIVDGVKFFLEMVRENVPPSKRRALQGGRRYVM